MDTVRMPVKDRDRTVYLLPVRISPGNNGESQDDNAAEKAATQSNSSSPYHRLVPLIFGCDGRGSGATIERSHRKR